MNKLTHLKFSLEEVLTGAVVGVGRSGSHGVLVGQDPRGLLLGADLLHGFHDPEEVEASQLLQVVHRPAVSHQLGEQEGVG